MNSGNFSQEKLKLLYEERFGKRAAYRNKVWRVLVSDFFQKYIDKGNTVLDLGAGYGEFINYINCAKKYAMDLNPDTPHKVGRDVTVFAQDCALPWPLPDKSLDVVFTSNFFEHLPDPDTLERTLKEAHRCLMPEGTLIALGPNIRYTGDTYWEVPDHRLALSDLTLSDALQSAGFAVKRRIDRFLPFTMATGPQYPILFVKAYLRVPVAWRFFGKQFLLIAQKP